MYEYDLIAQTLKDHRGTQFRDKIERRINGTLELTRNLALYIFGIVFTILPLDFGLVIGEYLTMQYSQ